MGSVDQLMPFRDFANKDRDGYSCVFSHHDQVFDRVLTHRAQPFADLYLIQCKALDIPAVEELHLPPSGTWRRSAVNVA